MRSLKLKITEEHISLQDPNAKLGGDNSCWTIKIFNIPEGVQADEVVRLAANTTWHPCIPMGEDFKNLGIGKINKTMKWEAK